MSFNVRPTLALGVCVALSLFGAVAVAQEPQTAEQERIQAQLKLNDEGVEQMASGNYKGAIQKFERALSEYGARDLVYLNLGRALYRDGQCLEAEKEYLKAIDPQTPKVGGDVTREMDSAVKRFLTELNQKCPAYMKVSCEPSLMKVYINGDGPQSCDGTLKAYEPGKYEIVGELDGQRTTPQTHVLERMQVASVQLSVTVKVVEKRVESPVIIKQDPNGNGNDAQQPQIIVISQPPTKPQQDSIVGPVTSIVLGALLVGGGMFWDTCGFSYFSQSSVNEARSKTTQAQWEQDTGWCYHTVNGQSDGLDWGPVVSYGVGALLMGLGTVILAF